MSSNDHGYLSAKALGTAPIAVTVLLCAYNEEAFLARTLDTLLSQDARFPYEIVIVDNNSTDRTADVARRYNTRVVLCEVRGKIPALRVGLNNSSGSIIAIADADTEYPPSWLSTIVGEFESHPSSVLVFGGTFIQSHSAVVRKVMSLATDGFILLSLRLGVVCSIGFNIAVRREPLSLVLKDLDHYAFTGWAIGTQCLRSHGMRKIVFESSLRVPKCMRRYERKGYLQSTGRWLGQWIRLLMRKQMTLMEADYFDFKVGDRLE